MVAQFTSSLFLTLCIVTGIMKSFPLCEILNSFLSQSIAHLYFLRRGLENINLGFGYFTTAKSSYMVQPEGKVISRLRTVPIDSVGAVAIPLKSYFTDLSIFPF